MCVDQDSLIHFISFLLLIDPLPAPSSLTCSNDSSINGLRISWSRVEDDSCANLDVVYYVEVVRLSDEMFIVSSFSVDNYTTDIIDVLQPSETYRISVRGSSLIGTINGLESIIVCDTAEDLISRKMCA